MEAREAQKAFFSGNINRMIRLTLTTGARQLVVHEAAVQMVCSSASRLSLQPITTFRTPSYTRANEKKGGEEHARTNDSRLRTNGRKNIQAQEKRTRVSAWRRRQAGQHPPRWSRNFALAWVLFFVFNKSRHECSDSCHEQEGAVTLRTISIPTPYSGTISVLPPRLSSVFFSTVFPWWKKRRACQNHGTLFSRATAVKLDHDACACRTTVFYFHVYHPVRASLTGAETTTLLTPPSKYGCSFSFVRNFP